jgi:hypothetical protein
MGIENPTARTENQESNMERSEGDIQSDLNALNVQLASIPHEESIKYDAYNLGKYAHEKLKSEGVEEGNPNLGELSKEEAAGLQKYDALLEQKGKVEEERNDFYKENPEAFRARLKELTKAVLLENIQKNPEYKVQVLEEGYFRNHMTEADWDSPNRRELRDLEHTFDKNGKEESDRSWMDEARTEVIGQIKRESNHTAPPAPSFQERVSPQTAEFMTSHILDKDLAYQDAELPKDHKEQMLQWSRSSESAKKYAESIAEAGNVGGLETVRNMAHQMRDTMLSEATRLGIPVSPQGKSLSWAMWDTGKQYHFFTHQNENDAQYEIGNPLESEAKREEIVNRHLGWEAYAAFQNNPEYRGRVSNNAPALTFFNKAPKQNGMLSSKDLAELGKVLRTQ